MLKYYDFVGYLIVWFLSSKILTSVRNYSLVSPIYYEINASFGHEAGFKIWSDEKAFAFAT